MAPMTAAPNDVNISIQGASPAQAGVAIRAEDPGASGVEALLRAGEAHMASLYPAHSNHMLPLDALRAHGVVFLVARDAQGRALATGAAAIDDGVAEIKRLWVEPTYRGGGLGRAMLAALEARARAGGAQTLRLETGVASGEALGLYERAGFRRRGPFGGYAPDPLSVFMGKALLAGPFARESAAP